MPEELAKSMSVSARAGVNSSMDAGTLTVGFESLSSEQAAKTNAPQASSNADLNIFFILLSFLPFYLFSS
jgi:hypothetical protein